MGYNKFMLYWIPENSYLRHLKRACMHAWAMCVGGGAGKNQNILTNINKIYSCDGIGARTRVSQVLNLILCNACNHIPSTCSLADHHFVRAKFFIPTDNVMPWHKEQLQTRREEEKNRMLKTYSNNFEKKIKRVSTHRTKKEEKKTPKVQNNICLNTWIQNVESPSFNQKNIRIVRLFWILDLFLQSISQAFSFGRIQNQRKTTKHTCIRLEQLELWSGQTTKPAK